MHELESLFCVEITECDADIVGLAECNVGTVDVSTPPDPNCGVLHAG